MTVVNLTSLAETRAKMTPGEYYAWGTTIMAHEPNADCFDEAALIGTATREDAAGIVAEHNAMPVLLEVARRVKDREVIEQVWRGVELCNIDTTMMERRIIYGCLCDVRQRYDAALAKVSL